MDRTGSKLARRHLKDLIGKAGRPCPSDLRQPGKAIFPYGGQRVLLQCDVEEVLAPSFLPDVAGSRPAASASRIHFANCLSQTVGAVVTLES